MLFYKGYNIFALQNLFSLLLNPSNSIIAYETITFFSFFLLSINSYAQVHINDDGKTIVGNQNNTDAPSFTIGDYSTITTARSYISNATKKIGLGISSIANADDTWGIRVINHQNNTGSSIGLMTYPVGTSNQSSYGVKSYGGRTSSTAYGVYGGLYGTVAKIIVKI